MAAMTPRIFTTQASLLFPFRWRLVGLSGVAVVAMLAGLVLAAPFPLLILLGSMVLVPWGLICIALWFHPERGTLGPASRLLGGVPEGWQSLLRWYAALSLTLYLMVAAVALPAMALQAWWVLR